MEKRFLPVGSWSAELWISNFREQTWSLEGIVCRRKSSWVVYLPQSIFRECWEGVVCESENCWRKGAAERASWDGETGVIGFSFATKTPCFSAGVRYGVPDLRSTPPKKVKMVQKYDLARVSGTEYLTYFLRGKAWLNSASVRYGVPDLRFSGGQRMLIVKELTYVLASDDWTSRSKNGQVQQQRGLAFLG
jgi:hypothetical protein